MIELRDVQLRELDALATSSAALIIDEGGIPPDPVTLRVRLVERLRHGGAVLFLTADADATGAPLPVGHALWRHEAHCTRIEQFRIAPGQRRRGLGRACLDLLVRTRLTQLPLEVRVLDDNPAGLAFWRAAGFRPDHPRLRLHVAPRPGA